MCCHAPLHLGPYDIHHAENTDGITKLDDKNGIGCKTLEFAKMWMQCIKIRIFPTIISGFFTAFKQNEKKQTLLLCFGVINIHAAYLLCMCVCLCVRVSLRSTILYV